MSYRGPSSIPDWSGTVSTLVEVLEDTLDGIDEQQKCGVRPDIIAMDALDSLNQWLDRIKVDLGV